MNATATQLTAKPVGLQNKAFACRYLGGLSVGTLDALVRAGKIKAVRPSPYTVRFTVEELDRYIASLSK